MVGAGAVVVVKEVAGCGQEEQEEEQEEEQQLGQGGGEEHGFIIRVGQDEDHMRNAAHGVCEGGRALLDQNLVYVQLKLYR